MTTGREGFPGGQDQSFQARRLKPEEFYPKVGQPEHLIRAVSPVFGEELLGLVTKQMVAGKIIRARLVLKNLGENPQELAVDLARPTGSSIMEIELSGDWQQELITGLPLISQFNGKVFRARSAQEWKDGKPVTSDNDRIEPGAPIAIGSTGKNVFFPFVLPEREFPNGARLLRFSSEFNPADGSMDVTGGKSEVCFVEKID